MSDIANQLKAGKLIAYPTETVWGVGCDAFCEKAVMALLALKNRPIDKGLIVLTDSVERILPFLEPLAIDRQNEIIATWQSPQTAHKQATTWLFPVPNGLKIPSWLTGSHDSLAIRVINHPIITKLCATLVDDDNPYGFLVSTSCNPATLAPATDFATAHAYFGNKVCYLQGETLGFDKTSQIRCAVGGGVIRI